MARELKVYGWMGYHEGKQTRDVVAAHSVAEALRLANIPRSTYNWSGSDTENEHEVAVAMSDPGVVFSALLKDSFRPDAEWRRVSDEG